MIKQPNKQANNKHTINETIKQSNSQAAKQSSKPSRNEPYRIEDQTFSTWTRLSSESNLYLKENLLFNLKLYGVLSNVQGEERGVFTWVTDQSGQGKYIDIERLNLMYQSDNYDLTIGKEYLKFGYSDILSVANILQAFNASNPLHPFKQGNWQCRYDYYIGNHSFSGYILPIDQANVYPPANSRWLGSIGIYGYYYYLFSGNLGGSTATTLSDYSISNHYYSLSQLQDWRYLFNYKGTFKGIDCFLYTYRGPGSYGVIKQNSGTKATYYNPIAWVSSGGLVKAFDSVKIYTDVLFQHSLNGLDDNFLRQNIGFKYKIKQLATLLNIQNFNFLIEYKYDKTTRKVQDNTIIISSKPSRVNNANLALGLEFQINDKTHCNFYANKNFEYNDYALIGSFIYECNDNLMFISRLNYFYGNDFSAFGQWEKNDSLDFGFTYKF